MTESRLGWRVNELLLLTIILFQVLDFFKLLSPFWDYVKKIMSWALIGYLLYRLSPSTLFFGERHPWWDGSLILTYFLFLLKDLASFAQVARERMLTHVLDFVTFVPQQVNGTLISVGKDALTTFQLLGFLPNASFYATPFATQLTMNTPFIPFTLQAGNQSVGALLQPYGLDGMILQLYNSLAVNTGALETWGFLLGLLGLILLGLVALRFPVKKPSILSLLKSKAFIWLLELAFYLTFFNLAAEWLAIAIDAPLLMTGLLVTLVLLLRAHRGSFTQSELLQRIVNFGTSFLKDLARLFTRLDTLLLGLSGLLVLHLLTDIGVFLVPYVTGLTDPLYFGHLGPGHEPLTTLAAHQPLAVILTYALGALGALLLLSLPAYIWYKSFQIRNRPSGVPEEAYHPDLPSWLLALSLGLLTSLALSPPFALHHVESALIGVDLQTRALTSTLGLVAAPLVALAVLLLTRLVPRTRAWFMTLLFGSSLLFFIAYTYEYFAASVTYYLREGLALLTSGQLQFIIVGATLLLFLLLTALFYAFGLVGFLYETIRE